MVYIIDEFCSIQTDYAVGIQLLPSSGVKCPVTRSTMSTSHQIPTPPRVNNFPTAVPVWPKQNLSMPRNPSKIEYSKVVTK